MEEEFYASVDQYFVTLLTDGSEVELCSGGRKKKLTLENLEEYIKLLIQTRLSEFDVQMKAIKSGINLIIPDNVLFFMTWQELDLRSTGSKTFDIDTLKKITNYDVSQSLLLIFLIRIVRKPQML